jgi:MFS family permease
MTNESVSAPSQDVIRLTPIQWLICMVAGLGFLFDLYEMLMLPLIVRPALGALGNLKMGTPGFNLWAGLLFFVPSAVGGVLALLGGYLMDLFGRRRILVWSILLYGVSACAASYSTPDVRSLAPHQVEQTSSAVQLFQELGGLAGRLILAVLITRVVTQRRLMRTLTGAALVVFTWLYFFGATHSLLMVEFGIFFATLFFNGLHSFWGNYLPRVFPTHLRGTGESFAMNVGGRAIGVSAALFTTQLANVIPGSGASRLAYSAGTVTVLACVIALAGSFWLQEPEGNQLPD